MEAVSVGVGVVLVVVAFIVHKWGIGPDALAWRVAQVLAFAGLIGVLAPVQGRLRGWTTQALTVAADALAEVINTTAYTDAIVLWTPRILAFVALVAWVGALLPKNLAKRIGRFASANANEKTAWGWGTAMALFGAVAGGAIGSAISGISALAADGSVGAVNYLFGGS